MAGLSDFRDYMKSFMGLVAAGVATTALVLVTAFVGIAPPWPVAIIQITAIAQLLALIFVYQRFKRSTRAKIENRMRNGLYILIFSLVVYLFAHSLMIFEMPNGDLGVRGLKCSSNAVRIFQESCPFLESKQIATAEFEADRLWTPAGLAGSRMLLLIFWIASFASLVNVVAAFVVYQRSK